MFSRDRKIKINLRKYGDRRRRKGEKCAIQRTNEILQYCLLLGLTFAEGSDKRGSAFEWDPEGNRKERIKNPRSLLPVFTTLQRSI